MAGLFCIAMGKHGAGELNYSSDIDISVFFDPADLALAPGIEAQAFATRFTERVGEILQRRTADGYVFRVDLRLRPDPSSTPVAVSLPAAYGYYESVGQNWERAAFIKARAVAGDIGLGEAFLADLQPFVWRRNLDFAAIADIHSIKRQIHAHKVDDRLGAAGADLKLGRGGIREIEFYVQTQQLILGGRQPELRSRGTLETLAILTRLGHVAPADAETLDRAYRQLRALEHRAQMIGDEQTHRLPEADAARKAVAALAGFARLPAFDAAVGRTLKGVNRVYRALFAGEEPLSSKHGSLVFTWGRGRSGNPGDPGPHGLRRRPAHRLGDPALAPRPHSGDPHRARPGAVHTALAPRLLDAIAASGAPAAAFDRFADFFSGVSAGVQLQSLLLAQPKLLDLLVRVMAFAPGFARTLSRRPAALDALLDPGFFAPVDAGAEIAARLHPEGRVRSGDGPGPAPAIRDRLPHRGPAAGRRRRRPGHRRGLRGPRRRPDRQPRPGLPGRGRAGGRRLRRRRRGDRAGQMRLAGDVGPLGPRPDDPLYRPASAEAVSAVKGWSAETFYARFHPAPGRGPLGADAGGRGSTRWNLQLRPSGTKGPVAVSAAAFERYYQGDAETWELLALTRAPRCLGHQPRLRGPRHGVHRGSPCAAPRDLAEAAHDVVEMRGLMTRERPAAGFWDLKLSPGGLVDIEFCAQFLQLAGAADGGPLRQNTAEALTALARRPTGPRRRYRRPAGKLAAPAIGLSSCSRSRSTTAPIPRPNRRPFARSWPGSPGREPSRPWSRQSPAPAHRLWMYPGASSSDADGTRFIRRSRRAGDKVKRMALDGGDTWSRARTTRIGSVCGWPAAATPRRSAPWWPASCPGSSPWRGGC